MKNHPRSPEEKAEETIENFGRINSVEPSAAFVAKMFARFDSEFSSKAKTPKWFWVAAVAIFAINVIAAYNYSGYKIKNVVSESNPIGTYYFQNETDWYQE